MADDVADLSVVLAAPSTKLERDLARQNTILAAQFKAMQASAATASSNMEKSMAASGAKVAKSLDMSKGIQGNKVQLAMLESVAHRTFDSIAAGQSVMRAVEMQAGDVVAAIAQGGGLMATLRAAGTSIAGLATPMNLALGGAGLFAAGLIYLATQQSDASKSAEEFDAWLKKIGADSDDVAKNVDKVTASIKGMTFVQATGLASGSVEALKQTTAEAMNQDIGTHSISTILSTPRNRVADPKTFASAQALKDLIDQTGKGELGAKGMHDALDGLAKANPNIDKVAAALQPILDKITVITGASDKLGLQLGNMGAYQPRPNDVLSPNSQQAIAGADARSKMTDLQLTAFDKAVRDRMVEIRDQLLKQQIVLPESEIRSRAVNEVTQEGINAGGGDILPALKAYVDRVIKAESGGDPTAKNPNSTASGVGQFIDSTWIALFKKYYPAQAENMGRDAILELKKDADVSKTLIEAYAKENAEALQKAGLSVTEANLQLSHFLGAGDATKVLKAAPGTPLNGLISSASIKANPSILGSGRTTDDAIAYSQRRATDTRVAAGDLTRGEQSKQSLDELTKGYDEQTAAMKAAVPAYEKNNVELETQKNYLDLLNKAKRDGIPIDATVEAKLRQEAAARAAVTVSTNQQAEANKRLVQNLDEVRGAAKDALSTFVNDLRQGKTLTESLGDALNSLVDKLLDKLEDNLISGLLGPAGTTGTGFLGGILSFLNLAEGGPVAGPGTGTSDSVPAMLSNGEYVVTAKQTKKHGVLLQAINDDRIGKFARGGLVGSAGMASGSFAPVTNHAAPIAINSNVTVNASGGTGPQNDDMAKKVSKAVEGSLRALVDDQLAKQLRPGNMLYAASRGR